MNPLEIRTESRSLLSLNNLHKSFFHRPVINSLSLSISPGETVGLLGKNGVGKTTLLRMISGISSPDKGQISFQERDLGKDPMARTGLLYLGHQPGLYPEFTALENLTFAARLHGLKTDPELIREALNTVGLTRQHEDRIKVYSQGMLQRLKLALAVLVPWSLLLLDEPFSGLDLLGRRTVHALIESWKSRDKIMLLVLHDLERAIGLCSRIVILDKGVAVLDRADIGDVPDEVRKAMEGVMT